LYSSYFGGKSEDRAEDLVLGPDGSVYITGKTISVNYPVSANAHAKTCPSGTDPTNSEQCANYEAFLVKFTPNFTGIAFSTYYGGDHKDYGLALGVDGSGSAYITGWTEGNDLPLLNQLQGYAGGVCYTYYNYPRFCIDSFVARFSTSGALIYSTFLGGGNDDFANDIAVESDGDAYVVGNTLSVDYPTTAGTIQASIPGPGKQGTILKIAPVQTDPQPPPPPDGEFMLYLPFTLR
jgi:hypothetical protein